MRRTSPVPPFLMAAEAAVVAEPWRLGDGLEPLAERLEHWDPDLTLQLARPVTVDLGMLLSSTGIEDPAALAVATTWRSERTRLRGAGMVVPLERYDGDTMTLSADVPGRVAGGRLDLQTVVVRRTDDPAAGPLSARRAGAVLWRDRITVALEGDAARFPVTVLDFRALHGLDAGAAWALDWVAQDLHEPVLGALRLLVNSRNDVVVAAVGGADDPRSLAITSTIHFDVARSLVQGALDNDDFVTGDREFEPDTVGRMLCELIDRYWPGVPPPSLRQRLRETPHRIAAEIQAATGLLAS